MSTKKGNISVQTGDIFPIIKKWLYSEHDIFIRELVANATDAITKRATLSRTQNREVPSGKIQILVNKKERTITVRDNGLGMSEQEIEKYIAQLAFSGAQEFIEKMETENQKGSDIIGKFGLGFYSSFMVADKVQIRSLSMQEGSQATQWTCHGETEYVFEECSKAEIGTDIVLHVNKESDEFLEAYRLTTVLKKFCDFMPHTIEVIDIEKSENPEEKEYKPTLVNETKPIWKRDPSELKDEDYQDFFRQQFPTEGDPLFWIHLRVDHPFTLEGVLYFPKINRHRPFNESNIKLFCKQVFVSDNVKDIIPDFLSLLKGHIDSPDIPLNVSRSSLQGDPNIKKISNYVIKKVAEALKKLAKKDRERYEKIWEDIGIFVKYGCVSDNKFDEVMRENVIFKGPEDKYLSLDEYRDSIPEKYADKMKELVLYFEKDKSDFTLRQQLNQEGIKSLEVDDQIDPHFMQHAEIHTINDKKIRFSSVEAEISNLLDSDSTNPEDIKVKELFESILIGKVQQNDSTDESSDKEEFKEKEIELAKLKNSTTPAYLKIDESMKRFSRMTQTMGSAGQTFPLKKTLVVNPSHPLVQNAIKIHEKGGHDDLVKKILLHIEDMANISSEGLKDERKEGFVTRTQDIIQHLTNLAL